MTMQVLFADDQSDTRQIFELAFKLRGHHATRAENGAEALKAMAAPSAARFDVIAMDWPMPLVDGVTAIRCIRSFPAGANRQTTGSFADPTTPAPGTDPGMFGPNASFVQPVPEPSTWAMMFLGLGGIAVSGWRKRRKDAV